LRSAKIRMAVFSSPASTASLQPDASLNVPCRQGWNLRLAIRTELVKKSVRHPGDEQRRRSLQKTSYAFAHASRFLRQGFSTLWIVRPSDVRTGWTRPAAPTRFQRALRRRGLGARQSADLSTCRQTTSRRLQGRWPWQRR